MVTSVSTRTRTARSPRPDGECLRYQLDVVATNAIDVVRSAGGWLYDRAMAGWEVAVLLPHGCDTRPLRILGLQPVEMESRLGASSHSLAVGVEAFSAHNCVRDRVRKALDHRLTEVALWGEGWPLGVDRGLTRAQHVLSAAARAFKLQALTAAGIDCASLDLTETLLTDAAWQG
ncbi:hypothetical protein [Mycobacterium sp. 1423905.2]|uniref:hypothetical protein n=1 Tax=Mycobacterium sp. 1423905.2 TaxID=1856859 RepID=UPI0007FF3089|nr:hypothetical protein [Mycobacterium sp. 1423905.2]OBJ47815.1 hypothetical protein A9W95_05890 [Mycobacterium sp. 1423905.2]